jgi:hypothetical protein
MQVAVKYSLQLLLQPLLREVWDCVVIGCRVADIVLVWMVLCIDGN